MNLNDYIKRAQKGDKTAFEQLEQLYRPETVYLAARFLLDGEEAKTVVKAVFEDAFEKITRLKDPELFERWLYWCVARECRERLRERVPALFTERENRRERDPAAGIPKRGDRIPPKKRELLEQITEAVDNLPVLQRFPFVYCRLCGYSIKETAAFMGLSEETAFFRVRSGEAALYEAVHAIKAAGRAGSEDIVLALRAYPERYLRPSEEELGSLPVPEEESAEIEEAPVLEDIPEEEPFEEEPETEGRSHILPLLIIVCSLLLAALVFFIFWTLKYNHSKKNSAPVEASFSVQAPTAEPGRTDVTALPKNAITPPPTFTPVPTFTPGPTSVPPDISGLEYVPESNEWISPVYRAFTCVQGSMNVRKGPATNYKSLGTLSAGQEVLVYGAKDSWYIVEYEPGKLGWASGKYILGLSMFTDRTNENLAGITPPAGEVTRAEVKTVGAFEGGKLYRDPSENATYTQNVEFGAKVCLLSFDGDWVFVNKGGNFGWMRKDAFDTSNAMDVSGGTYFYSVSENAVIEDTGSLVKTDATLKKQEYVTPANLEKYLNGETVKTKKGTKLKPGSAETEKSTEEAEPGLPREVSVDEGELRFVYDAEEKLYALYSYSAPKLYSYKKVMLMIRPDAVVKDERFCPVYETGVPSYGTVNGDGCFVTEGIRLDDYVDYVRSCGVYDGLSGTVMIRNGAVCELTIGYEE